MAKKNKNLENDFTEEDVFAQVEDRINIDEDSGNFGNSEQDNPRIETLKEAIAPTAMKRGATDYIIVGSKYVRTFYIEGFPDEVGIGYLSNLFDKDYDLDISISSNPRVQSKARKELQDKLTIVKAQLKDEIEQGANRNRDKYQNTIQDLETQLADLTSKTEQAFETQLFFSLYADSKKELERNTNLIIQDLKSVDITAQVFALRQDSAWKSVLPYGKDYVNDKKRNFTTGAVISSIPYYLPELYDEYGVYLGENVFTGTPALIDLYRPGIQNSNVNIFGAAGSGKSTLVKTLTMRSALSGIKTVIIDPEGEYEQLTKKMHGSFIRLTSDVRNSRMMNIFDIEEDESLDNNGNKVRSLDLRSKYEDVLGFLQVADNAMTQGQAASVLEVLRELYATFGFVDGDPDSLYHNDDVVVVNGVLKNNAQKKRVPQLSDFLDLMDTMVKDGTFPELKEVYNALQPYRHQQTRGLFDTQTPPELANMRDSSIITFDISGMESTDTRTVAMYVLLSWTWEKFGKKNPETLKRILVDEAWMMMAPSMKGYEYTSTFLENMSRRIRKRNGALAVASQRVQDFANSQAGAAIISNAHTTFLLSHEKADQGALEKAFDLDAGVVGQIIEAQRGLTLIKQASQLYLVNVKFFNSEKQVVTGSAASDNN